MTKKTSGSAPKLVLSSSRDIPFSQLVLSQKNVRRVKAGLSIEDLAEDIYRRTLLQSLNVRAMLDDDGKETGFYEVPAGGRRFRALELLVKSKRMAKDQPVPCVVREGGIAEEDSLAENVMREGLHPLDQFRAFSTLIEAGLSEEDIAARFFVSVSTVRQRLRLASVSPSLLDVYGEDGMSLEQLMAFTVTDNHARQEQVWEQVNQGQHVPAYHIRRLLTEQTVAASDRRARFIGIDAYTEAGGYVMRDLFSTDEDDCDTAVRFRKGWFLGDGTGAGKGRQVAGIVLDNWLKGRRRAVWISKSDKLLEDAQRDWKALGQEPLLVTPLARFRQGTPIRLEQGILFTTYATLRSDARESRVSRVQQIVDWLGTDFDGVIVFDESHAMQNAGGGKSDRGDSAPSHQGRAGLRLQHALPEARVSQAASSPLTLSDKWQG